MSKPKKIKFSDDSFEELKHDFGEHVVTLSQDVGIDGDSSEALEQQLLLVGSNCRNISRLQLLFNTKYCVPCKPSTFSSLHAALPNPWGKNAKTWRSGWAENFTKVHQEGHSHFGARSVANSGVRGLGAFNQEHVAKIGQDDFKEEWEGLKMTNFFLSKNVTKLMTWIFQIFQIIDSHHILIVNIFPELWHRKLRRFNTSSGRMLSSGPWRKLLNCRTTPNQTRMIQSTRHPKKEGKERKQRARMRTQMGNQSVEIIQMFLTGWDVRIPKCYEKLTKPNDSKSPNINRYKHFSVNSQWLRQPSFRLRCRNGLRLETVASTFMKSSAS